MYHSHKLLDLINNIILNTILFADDYVIIFDREDGLQRAVLLLEKGGKTHNLKISIVKTKTWPLKEVRIEVKGIIDKEITEQVSKLKYSGCEDKNNKLKKVPVCVWNIKENFGAQNKEGYAVKSL
jgi:hypothetical protein